jgi:GntR family transcriptional repressor for pyruvate dehydrogenase complex
MLSPPKVTTTQALFDEMLRRIQSGEWPVGKSIPSERALIKEMDVSRIALREALSMLRSLGVLDTSHGRKSVVRQVGTELIDRIVPLIITLEPVSGFHQVFEMRLAIEVPAAALAAARRTPEQLARLEELANEYAEQNDVDLHHYPRADLEFHLQIARSTGNPLFTALLNVISRYVIAGQRHSWGTSRPIAWDRAKRAHFAIYEAIRDQDPDRARVEMEAHLRYTATLVPRSQS